nr:hypothetical protein [Pandoravirus massiliensis]
MGPFSLLLLPARRGFAVAPFFPVAFCTHLSCPTTLGQKTSPIPRNSHCKVQRTLPILNLPWPAPIMRLFLHARGTAKKGRFGVARPNFYRLSRKRPQARGAKNARPGAARLLLCMVTKKKINHGKRAGRRKLYFCLLLLCGCGPSRRPRQHDRQTSRRRSRWPPSRPAQAV